MAKNTIIGRFESGDLVVQRATDLCPALHQRHPDTLPSGSPTHILTTHDGTH